MWALQSVSLWWTMTDQQVKSCWHFLTFNIKGHLRKLCETKWNQMKTRKTRKRSLIRNIRAIRATFMPSFLPSDKSNKVMQYHIFQSHNKNLCWSLIVIVKKRKLSPSDSRWWEDACILKNEKASDLPDRKWSFFC